MAAPVLVKDNRLSLMELLAEALIAKLLPPLMTTLVIQTAIAAQVAIARVKAKAPAFATKKGQI